MPEISDADLAVLQQNKAILDLLGGNPDTRRIILKAIKTASPKTPIPEIDAAAPFEERLAEMQKKLDEEREARAKEADERAKNERIASATKTLDSQKAELRAMGATDEGIDAAMKLATERGIPDLVAAFALHERMQPPADERPFSPSGLRQTWNFGEIPGAEDKTGQKLLYENPNAWAAQEINRGLAELRGRGSSRLRA